MILGTGNDLLDSRRLGLTLERFGARFTRRLFTEAERERCESRPDPVAAYALRYAAKEAAAKALGTGFRQGVYWRDLEVHSLPGGRPALRFHGGAARFLNGMVPLRHEAVVHLALTDEPPYAMANVVIEARPLADEGSVT